MSNIINHEMIEIVYPLQEVSCLEVWDIIYEHLQIQDFFSIDISVDLNGRKITIDRVRDRILKSSVENFNIKFNEINLFFVDLIASNFGLINVKNKSDSIKLDWDDLVNRFYKEEKFIQAWVSDVEYELWQNAKNISQYQWANKPYKHLPIIHNGKPPPLGREEIDISKNPGRRIIKETNGYIEAIGSQIWVGDGFWERVGTNKQDIMERFPKELEIINEGLIKFTFQEKLFSEKSDKELQNKIREVLFGVKEKQKRFLSDKLFGLISRD